MCGICGRFERSPLRAADPRIVTGMADRLRHRGPDDSDVWSDGPVALGHTRLSIIDLEGGAQPLANERGSVRIVFNGEIYNYRSLGEDLRARGHRFRTQSDTEVIVHAYEEWGRSAVTKLVGMFAFALWDDDRQRLLLVRDRLGIKPLFYWIGDDGTVAFASEIRSLLATPELDAQPDLSAIDQYLGLQYVPIPRSGLEGVRKLPPAHTLTFEADSTSLWEYWTPDPVGSPDLGRSVACEQLRSTLTEAVSSHLVSDVPIGSFLSGGVDSGVVTALMARSSAGPVRAITVGFDDAEFDERSEAAVVARRYGCSHRKRRVDVDAEAAFRHVVRHLDEPFGDWSAIPTYLVAEAARKDVKVVLSGDGGDELFGGYARHRVQRLERLVRGTTDGLPPELVRRLADLYPSGWPGAASVRNLGLPFVHALARKHAHGFFASVEDRNRLYGPALRDHLHPGSDGIESYVEPFRRHFDRVEDWDPLAAALYVELKTYLVDDILTKVDRMSMAHSLEVRVPFLDHRVVELALAIPPAMKVGWTRGKKILRWTFEDLLPSEQWRRRKRGFDIPAASWLRGKLKSVAADHLLDGSLAARGIVRQPEVERLWEEHQQVHADHSRKLWALLMLEAWLRDVNSSRTSRSTPSRAAPS